MSWKRLNPLDPAQACHRGRFPSPSVVSSKRTSKDKRHRWPYPKDRVAVLYSVSLATIDCSLSSCVVVPPLLVSSRLLSLSPLCAWCTQQKGTDLGFLFQRLTVALQESGIQESDPKRKDPQWTLPKLRGRQHEKARAKKQGDDKTMITQITQKRKPPKLERERATYISIISSCHIKFIKIADIRLS